MHQAFLRFNNGELSPYLAHVIDFEKHPGGTALCENLIPLPFGGAMKRPGTLDLAALDDDTRLESFTRDDSESYILAISPTSISIFNEDGSLSQEIIVAFDDPFALQFAHLNDNLFIADPTGPPQMLVRNAVDDWSISDIPFTAAPLLDENTEETSTITVDIGSTVAAAWATSTAYAVGDRVTFGGETYISNRAHTSSLTTEPTDGATFNSYELVNGYLRLIKKPIWTLVILAEMAVPGATVTLTSSQDLFNDPLHVGAYWQISKERSLAAFEVELDATAGNDGLTSDPIDIQGAWSFATFGTWDGTFTIERQAGPGEPWEDIRAYESSKDRNVSIEGFEKNRVLLRLRWDHIDAGTSNPRGVLSAEEAFLRGMVQITEVTSPTTATAVVIQKLENQTTFYWAEGAFSPYQGFPPTVGFHDRRLVFGGTTRQPVSLWLSATDDFLNFLVGTEDDDAIFITLAATRQEPIRWIASQRRLFVGTAGGEWVFGSDTNDEPISPSNLLAREHTNYGSASLPALRIHSSIFFIERQRRRLREFSYLLEKEAYDAADLTRLAEHITEGGISQMAWQANREPVLWAIRADGTALAFQYHRSERMAAWTRHTTAGGSFKSVAVIRNDSGDDEVFFAVQRGETLRLEKLAPGQQLTQEQEAVNDCHHVDAGVIATTTGPTNDITTPAHLDGTLLNVLADGIFLQATPAAGTLSLPFAATTVHAGLPITSRLTTLPQDIRTDDGTSLARRKRANEVVLDLFKSRGGAVTYDGEATTINYTSTGELTDLAPDLFTGWTAVTLPPAHLDDIAVTISHTEPYPFTLRSMVLRWQLHEP